MMGVIVVVVVLVLVLVGRDIGGGGEGAVVWGIPSLMAVTYPGPRLWGRLTHVIWNRNGGAEQTNDGVLVACRY
jgi:hypothetical protein